MCNVSILKKTVRVFHKMKTELIDFKVIKEEIGNLTSKCDFVEALEGKKEQGYVKLLQLLMEVMNLKVIVYIRQ